MILKLLFSLVMLLSFVAAAEVVSTEEHYFKGPSAPFKQEHFEFINIGETKLIPREGEIRLHRVGTILPSDGQGFHVWYKTGLIFDFVPFLDSKWTDYRFIQVIKRLSKPLIKSDMKFLNRFPFIDPIFHVLLDGKKTPYPEEFVDERVFYWSDKIKQTDYQEAPVHSYFDAPDWGKFHAELYLVKSAAKPSSDKKRHVESEYIKPLATMVWGYDNDLKQAYFFINSQKPHFSKNFEEAVEQFGRDLYNIRVEKYFNGLEKVPEAFQDYFERMEHPFQYIVDASIQ